MGIYDVLRDQSRSRYFYYRSLWSRAANDRAVRHTLPGQLLVSLTSYPVRFPSLAATVRCLLRQSVQPDAVILWISRDDMVLLPKSVQRLRSSRFQIQPASELRSYKKIIPCLQQAPAAFIVTCDDDALYPPTWLEGLLHGYQQNSKLVSCNRAHRILHDQHGNFLPYLRWEMETNFEGPSADIFPTGIGGVLYEPGVFHGDVTNQDRFQELCPNADDIWLWWMAALNGNRFKTTTRMNTPITWPASQHSALSGSNAFFGQGNDEQIGRMLSYYGKPNPAGR